VELPETAPVGTRTILVIALHGGPVRWRGPVVRVQSWKPPIRRQSDSWKSLSAFPDMCMMGMSIYMHIHTHTWTLQHSNIFKINENWAKWWEFPQHFKEFEILRTTGTNNYSWKLPSYSHFKNIFSKIQTQPDGISL
jgi:hypothetical protein